jgi:predicted lysophospholipase L1 biosynthesis ABC-type transport system permease subunit
MWTNDLPHLLIDILAAIFVISAIIDIAGSHYFHERFREWQHPRQFYRVMGVLQLFTALFLAVSQLRIWGIIFGGLITFFWVVILLNHRQWSWAAAGMLMLVALAPASLAIY